MNKFEYASFRAFELCRATGYLSDRECLALQVACWSLPKFGKAVNIGAGAGTSSLAICEAQPAWDLTTVDISAGGPNGGLQNEINAFTEFGFAPLIPHQILGDSKTVEWNGGSLQFLFIDGDHSEAGLQGDMDNWIRYVSPGCLVAFHDYDRNEWPDVAVCVDRLVASGRAEFVFIVDTLAVVRMAEGDAKESVE